VRGLVTLFIESPLYYCVRLIKYVLNTSIQIQELWVLITELYYKTVIMKIIYELAILNQIVITSWYIIFQIYNYVLYMIEQSEADLIILRM
jgi:hypothetical protein